MSATQQGVEDVHERLMEKLAPSESAEPVVDALPEVTEEIEVEVEAPITEEVVEETVALEPSETEVQEVEPSESQEIELSHIAEYLGATEDQFTVNDDGELFVRTKVDGEEGQAKFSDILKSYQLEGHLNKQSTEVAETQKALQTKLANADEQLSQKVQQLEDLSQIAYNDLLTDYNAVNWEELRQDDPAEYSAKKADYQNRQTQIAQLYQKAQDQRQDLKAVDSEGMKERLADEGKKLLQAIPEWTDKQKYQDGWTKTGTYAQTLGFSTEEFNSTADHRMILLLNKARQFDELQKGSTSVTKLVRKAPKIAKPGSTAQKLPSDQAKAQKLRQQLKRDGGKGQALHELLLNRV